MTNAPFSFAELGDPSPVHREHDDASLRAGPVAYGCYLKDFDTVDPNHEKATKPDPLYTAEDLALAVDEARRATAAEVEAELRTALANDIEQHRCDLLSSLRDQITWHKSAYERELARTADVGFRLALALAKAVIPRAIEQQPMADIDDLLRNSLVRLARVPSIELRLPSDLADYGEAIVADLAGDIAWTGELKVMADPALGAGDAQLRWHGGAIDRRLHQLEDEAMHLADHWLRKTPEASHDDVEASSTARAAASEDGEISEQAIDPGSANE